MWQQKLKQLEDNKQWDTAIEFMEMTLKNRTDRDVYIALIFLLMNLLVEENFDISKHDFYAEKLKHYFAQSYPLFLHDPEYLFCIGITAVMSEWYLDLTQKDWEHMLQEAYRLAPNNILYQWAYYSSLDLDIPDNKKIAHSYAQLITEKNSKLFEELHKRGAFGDYIEDCMIGWAKKVLDLHPYDDIQ